MNPTFIEVTVISENGQASQCPYKLYLTATHIVCYRTATKAGNVIIHLATGDRYEIDLTLSSFRETFNV